MAYLARLVQSCCFLAGFLLFLTGCGPLIAVSVAAGLGLIAERNPNPVGPGILFALTLWPSLILMVFGLAAARADGGATMRLLNDLAFGRTEVGPARKAGRRVLNLLILSGAITISGLLAWRLRLH
jgi:hypothetical protein